MDALCWERIFSGLEERGDWLKESSYFLVEGMGNSGSGVNKG